MTYQRFIRVVDDFYAQPAAVVRRARTAAYFEPDDATGFRSHHVFHERGVRARLQRLLGLRIVRWDTDPAEGNGIFYMGLSHGRQREVPAVHFDHPSDDVTVVVYLSPGLPADCGTSHWMHRATGLADAPSAADAPHRPPGGRVAPRARTRCRPPRALDRDRPHRLPAQPTRRLPVGRAALGDAALRRQRGRRPAVPDVSRRR
jgi:hypothetical protein